MYIGSNLSQMGLMKRLMWVVMCAALCHCSAFAQTKPITTFDNKQQEQLYRELITELRCPKCQNQNLDGSASAISVSLKTKIAAMVKQNHSKKEITDFMVARYGDFITYKPPMNVSTYILWFLPPLLLFIAFAILLFNDRKQKNGLNSNDNQNKDID